MYINFQQNRVKTQVMTVLTSLFAKKSQIALICNLQLEFQKSSLSDIHYPLTETQADFEINRSVRYRNTTKRNDLHRRQTDRRTDGRTDRRRVRQQ